MKFVSRRTLTKWAGGRSHLYGSSFPAYAYPVTIGTA